MLLQRIVTSWSIRRKLLLLILTVLLPAAGIIVLDGIKDRRQELEDAKHHAALMVASLSTQQEQFAAGTRQMLRTLAQSPQVQSLDAEACNKLLRELKDQNPIYSVIGVVTPDGNMFANAAHVEPDSVNLSDRKYIKDAIKTLDFSPGEYIVGRVSNVPSINYGYPVLDAGKRLIAIVFAGFRLTEYDSFIKKANLPQDSAATIFDHQGLRLYRYPENDAAALGRRPKDGAAQIPDMDEGTFERKSDDGIYRLFAFKRLRLTESSSPYLLIVSGVPQEEILEKANFAMACELLILGLAATIAACLAWFLGNVAFTRPINRLVSAVHRFGSGEMEARTGLPHTHDELGELAQSFDSMAELLEQRSQEKKKAEEELKSAFRKNDLILNAADEGIIGLDQKGTITFANPAARRTLGYDEEELIGKDLHMTIHHSFPDGTHYPVTECPMWQSLQDGTSHWVRDEVLWKKDGTSFPTAYSSTPIMEKGQVVGSVVTFRDISVRRRVEEALFESENKFKSFAEQAFAGIYLIQDGVFKYVNPKFAQMFGYTVEECLNDMPFKNLVYGEDLAKVEEQVGKRISGETESVQYPFRGLKKSGLIFPVEIYGSTNVHKGKPAALGTILDVTERKRVEEFTRLRLALFEFSASHSLAELLQKTLDEVGALTNSPIGFYHFVESDQKTISLQAWSTRTLKEFCKAEGKGLHYPIDQAGVWADCVHEKRPVIHNDYSALSHRRGMPAGHAAVIRELVVPIMRSGRIVAILGIGNKPADYTEEDVAIVSDLADVAWEITEHKRAENKLRESEARFGLAVRSAKMGVWSWNIDEDKRYFDDRVSHLLGIDLTTFTGKSEEFFQFVHPDDHETISTALHRTVTEDVLYEADYRAVWPDGSLHYIRTRGRLYRDEAGRPKEIIGVLWDITERKQAEEKLRELTGRINLATASAKAGVWDWNIETNEMIWDDRMFELYGLTRENFPGGVEAWEQGLHPDDSFRAIEESQAAVNGQRDFDTEFRVRHPDGTVVHLKANGIVLRNEEGKPLRMIGLNIDITERKTVEAEKIELEERLRQVQKEESLGRMAGSIAHIFNNQLAVVIGNLELALMDLSENAIIRKDLNEAMRAARRSADVSGLMLTYLGQSTATPEPLDLSEICRHNLPMLRDAMPEGIVLKTDLLSSGPVVRANANQMQQVLTNLITNGWESMGRSAGTVTLATRIILAPEIPNSRLVSAGWKPAADVSACLEVTDTGCGMAEEDLDKIFDPFFTTKFTGRGLGLAVVVGIVKTMGGAIGVESKKNQGSTFRVFLPLVADEFPVSSEKATEVHRMEQGGTVLLVEDQDMVRKMAESMLKRMGYEVLAVSGGAEAVQLFRENPDQIRLVITDLTMPGMDGWETLTALREIRPHIPVILASGHDVAHAMGRDYPEQPHVFLHKPYLKSDLEAAIDTALKRAVSTG